MLIVGDFVSGKINALSNLINNQVDFDKIYLPICNRCIWSKISIFNQQSRKSRFKQYDDPKVFIASSTDMQDVYKNIEEYNPGTKRKMLIIFDNMIADMINNKKLNPVGIELFLRGTKLNISIVFITQPILKWQKKLD